MAKNTKKPEEKVDDVEMHIEETITTVVCDDDHCKTEQSRLEVDRDLPIFDNWSDLGG